MRSKDKHMDYSPMQLQEVFESKLNTQDIYYHDVGLGIVYAHKNISTGEYEHPLVDVYALTGLYHIEVRPKNGAKLVEFNITSGFSKGTLEILLKDKGLQSKGRLFEDGGK